MPQDQTTPNPGTALTRFVVLAASTALCWWIAERGVPQAWIGVWILGLSAFAAFFGIFKAHRVWKESEALRKRAAKPSKRYDTNPNRRRASLGDGWGEK